MFQLSKINRLKKLIILIMISNSLFALEKDYNFYDIEECTIPISKTLKLIRQDSKYEYNFFQTQIVNNHILINKIDIRNKTDNDYNDIINTVKRSEKENWEEPIKLIKEYQYKGFIVIIRQLDSKMLIYNLIGKKSTMFIAGDSINVKTINYLMDYCRLHPSK